MDEYSSEIARSHQTSYSKGLIMNFYNLNQGAILSSVDNQGNVRNVAYTSRFLSKIEQKYSQTEREALAVVLGCEKFHLFLSEQNSPSLQIQYRSLQLQKSSTVQSLNHPTTNATYYQLTVKLETTYMNHLNQKRKRLASAKGTEKRRTTLKRYKAKSKALENLNSK